MMRALLSIGARGAAVISAALALTGCAGLSGLDAESKFACKAPDGVTCMSVSGIYANSVANNLPGLRPQSERNPAQQADGAETKQGSRVAVDYGAPENPYAPRQGTAAVSPKAMSAPQSGAPIRTAERVLRVWLAPYTDVDGDLHDQSYFYMTVAGGQWLVQSNQDRIRQAYQQVTPIQRTAAAKARAAQPAPQQQALELVQPGTNAPAAGQAAADAGAPN